MVEFALVIPVLLIVVLGIIDFGRAINYWNDENQVAEIAARYVAVGTQPTWSNFPTKGSCTQPSDLSTLVKYEACLDSSNLGNGGSSTPGGVTVHACYPSNAVGQPVKITVSANYQWLPVFGSVFGDGGSLPITGTATMRLENQITPGTWVPASDPSPC
jgi:Flp pilus assembly protein TadG